jgi:predicted Zn-dependent protease
MLAWTGDLRAALEILDAVPEKLRDASLLYYRHRGALRAGTGNVTGAMADYERARAIAAQSTFQTSGPRTTRVFVTLSLANLAVRSGDAERALRLRTEALAAARQIVIDHPNLSSAQSALARALATQGDRTAALAAHAESTRLVGREGAVMKILFQVQGKANTLVTLGETAAAISELRAAHDMGRAFGYRLRLDPEWEPLRGDPNFHELMKEAEARANAQPRPKRAE